MLTFSFASRTGRLASHDPRQVHNSLGLALAVCQRGVSVSCTTAAALVHELP